MNFKLNLLFCLSVIIPSFSFEFRKCKLPDPECMRESAQDMLKSFGDGIPEYNVRKLDPFTKDRIDLSTPNLNTVMSNIIISGLKKCKIIKLKVGREAIEIKKHKTFNREDGYTLPSMWDPIIEILKVGGDKPKINRPDIVSVVCRDMNFVNEMKKKKQCGLENLKLTGQAECDLNIEADYEMDGKVLVLAIQGKGKARIGLKKLVVSIDGNWVEVTGKDGKMHWKIKNYTSSYELKGKSFIRLDNLFNGNEALGRAVNALFDTSPNDVILEMAPPFVDFISRVCLENVSHFLRALPIEDLVLK